MGYKLVRKEDNDISIIIGEVKNSTEFRKKVLEDVEKTAQPSSKKAKWFNREYFVTLFDKGVGLKHITYNIIKEED